MPMIFAFHGAGRTNEQFRTVDARTQGHPIEDGYVIVYLKSDGNDWLASSNQAKFSNAYDTMLESNCIDTSRVFAMGHSSGAQFITTLLCGGEDRFLGTAPVAGGIIGACNSHPAIHQIYIHGSMDQERGNNGQQGADLIIGLNGCSGSMPMDQAGCMSDGQSVDPGCSEYQGCTHRTIWCSHNDPYYNGTNHGWPCFANDAILAFFDSLSPV
jgi:polyhydroxybutyrate depolymerase